MASMSFPLPFYILLVMSMFSSISPCSTESAIRRERGLFEPTAERTSARARTRSALHPGIPARKKNQLPTPCKRKSKAANPSGIHTANCVTHPRVKTHQLTSLKANSPGHTKRNDPRGQNKQNFLPARKGLRRQTPARLKEPRHMHEAKATAEV